MAKINIFLLSDNIMGKTSRQLPCRIMRNYFYHGPKWFCAKSIWQCNERNIFLLTVQNVITRTWYGHQMRKQENLPTASNANLHKDYCNGDSRYITTDTTALHAMQNETLIFFYFFFSFVITTNCHYQYFPSLRYTLQLMKYYSNYGEKPTHHFSTWLKCLIWTLVEKTSSRT